MMKKVKLAASPDAYVKALKGWRRDLVAGIRSGVTTGAKLDESIKWGNIFYQSNGPLAMIRAEDKRVLFGFWRGQKLRHIEERLKPGGKYEMATIELREGDSIAAATVKKLVKEAVKLNKALGNPTDL